MKDKEMLELSEEIKILKERIPKVVLRLSDLAQAKIELESFMDKIEGSIIPQYLYRISDKEGHSAYLFGTQHVTDAKVFCSGLLDIVRGCKTFVTEVQLINDEQEDIKDEQTDLDNLTLPRWAQNMSRYDQNFLESFFKEYGATSIEDASPHQLLGLIQVTIFETMAPKGIDKQLAEYFKKQVEEGKLSWLENILDREKAEMCSYKSAELTHTEELSPEDKYYINLIDKTITELCNAQNYNFILRIVRYMLGIESFTHDMIKSIHYYLEGKVKLNQDAVTDLRTSNWIQKIDDLICSEDDAFIAVGVQHLLGENGLLDHLNITYSIEHILLDA